MNTFLWMCFKINNALSLCNVKDLLGFARQWVGGLTKSYNQSAIQTRKQTNTRLNRVTNIG